jgi:GT2 family glycosyltransferase
VIVSVSDASATADRAAAQQLADKDPRVRVVVADRLGPGPARNAGIAVASGSFIALLDDDCQAQPGWLRAGIEALREVDLVQGKTYPGDGISRPTDKTIWVLKFSGLWESCNLLFRRSVIDRFGGFDESWNPSGRRGDHYGEDTEWGWRVVRSGATYAFVPEALVHHAVFRRTLREWFRYNAKTRYFPLIVRDAPEVRETFFYKHFFFQRRHVAFAVGELLLVVAGVGKVFGRDRAARSLALLSVAAFTGRHARRVACEVGEDVTRAAALIYGTARYRRIVL